MSKIFFPIFKLEQISRYSSWLLLIIIIFLIFWIKQMVRLVKQKDKTSFWFIFIFGMFFIIILFLALGLLLGPLIVSLSKGEL